MLASRSLLQVLLAVDYSVHLFHGREHIQKYLLTFMNIVSPNVSRMANDKSGNSVCTFLVVGFQDYKVTVSKKARVHKRPWLEVATQTLVAESAKPVLERYQSKMGQHLEACALKKTPPAKRHQVTQC